MIWEMLVILIVALVVFGPNQLPQLAKTLGRLCAFGQQIKQQSQATLDETLQEIELEKREQLAKQTDQHYQQNENHEP
jgi:Tat protein translocase TatB subunit